MADKISNQQGMAMKIFDIIFIFALAFICVVTPVFIGGGLIVGGGGIGDAIVWNTPGYFGTLLIIIVFFTVILYHSVKNYDY
ncbi:MAG: AcrB/AcrD/AcrF family protein [Methanosarcinales archaeon]|jgi:hypothetical protein|nr:AcrB/AcrD/AcrF family protein [Methanosarcinales archaeon]